MLFVVASRHTPQQWRRIIEQLDIPALNVGLRLSEQLRYLPPDRRPLEVGRILRSMIASHDRVLLDHIEYLFDVELRQNPIRLFEHLSGNTTLIIHWPGSAAGGNLIYASSEHPEHYTSDKSYAGYIIEI